MAKIREFTGLRPADGLAAQVAELPYDVVSSEEARCLHAEAVGQGTFFVKQGGER